MKSRNTHILGLLGVAANLGLLGAVVSGVSDKATPTPPFARVLSFAPGGSKWPFDCKTPPALLLLIMAGPVMTDFAIEECCACFRVGGIVGDIWG